MSAWNVHHASTRNINKQTIGVVALLGFKHVSFRTNSLIRSQQFEGQSGRTACADTGGVDREEESWAARILFYCQLLESFLFKLAFVSPSSCLLLWLWKSVVAPGLLLVLRTVFVLFFNNLLVKHLLCETCFIKWALLPSSFVTLQSQNNTEHWNCDALSTWSETCPPGQFAYKLLKALFSMIVTDQPQPTTVTWFFKYFIVY